jgi:hypothetical protein
MVHFNLVPFEKNIRIKIDGSVSMNKTTISLGYQLSGELNSLQWPAQSVSPGRKVNLWQATCFEMFISNPSEPVYHEFNLSPSEDWHSFSFSDYRTGMSECDQLLLGTVHQAKGINGLKINANIECLLPRNAANSFQIGVSAILLDQSGDMHYFALSHERSKPDFHVRDSHLLKLHDEES